MKICRLQKVQVIHFARSDMNSFVDSLVAPLSVINALIVAIGLKKKSIYRRALRGLKVSGTSTRFTRRMSLIQLIKPINAKRGKMKRVAVIGAGALVLWLPVEQPKEGTAFCF